MIQIHPPRFGDAETPPVNGAQLRPSQTRPASLCISSIVRFAFRPHISESHMFDLTPFTPSKRRCRNEAASQPSNQPRNNKKQKCGLSQGSQPPARFWDNLSKIDLTKAALKELDRRNAQGQPNATHALQRRGLITRRSTARERNPPSVAAVLTRETQALKRFARHGGPDLGQLKGVCCLFKHIRM